MPQKSDSPPPARGFIADWAVNLVVLLFGVTTIAQPFVIPSSSMEDNLLIGDHVIVDKMAYAPPGAVSKYLLPYTPVKHGDIIVFRYPIDLRQTLVKRAIGLPGDRIRILNKQVYLNGQALREPYKYHKTNFLVPYRDTFPGYPAGQVYPRAINMLRDNVVDGEVVVPPDCYFAMGDNRDVSLDSRDWGFVPRDNIVGKPWLIFWSYDAPGEALSDGNIHPDHILDMALHFFSKTRWRRTFQLIR
jgi:signal peptidase I